MTLQQQIQVTPKAFCKTEDFKLKNMWKCFQIKPYRAFYNIRAANGWTLIPLMFNDAGGTVAGWVCKGWRSL
jgi:CRISPR/Cas system CMR-associated protein Cmr1 (group 7 of RAMP superfamily)